MDKHKTFLDEFPKTDHMILSIHIDYPAKKEYLICGEKEVVRKKLERGFDFAAKAAPKPSELFWIEAKPYGELLNQYLSISPRRNDWMIAKNQFLILGKLYRTQSWKADETLQFLHSILSEGNMIERYLLLKLLEIYRTNAKNDHTFYMDAIDRLWLPIVLSMERRFLCNSENAIMDMNFGDPCEESRYFLDDILYQSYLYDVKVLFSGNDARNCCYYTDDNFLILIDWYMNLFYTNKMYLVQCHACKRIFITKRPNQNTICSEKCKRIRTKIVKKNFNERMQAHTVKHEIQKLDLHYNNKIRNLKEFIETTDHEYVIKLANKYKSNLEEEKEQYMIDKGTQMKLWKEKNLSDEDFLRWLQQKRDHVDELFRQWKEER